MLFISFNVACVMHAMLGLPSATYTKELKEGHKRPSSSIGNHIISHSGNKKEILNTDHFKILKRCHSKFDCLLYEMLFIRNLKPPLNVQSDSIKAKLFI